MKDWKGKNVYAVDANTEGLSKSHHCDIMAASVGVNVRRILQITANGIKMRITMSNKPLIIHENHW